MNALGVDLIFGAFIEKIKTIELINSKKVFKIGIYSIQCSEVHNPYLQ